jgi:hypothetical protein
MHGGRCRPQNLPLRWMSAAQQLARPPVRLWQPEPPHRPHSAGQQAGIAASAARRPPLQVGPGASFARVVGVVGSRPREWSMGRLALLGVTTTTPTRVNNKTAEKSLKKARGFVIGGFVIRPRKLGKLKQHALVDQRVHSRLDKMRPAIGYLRHGRLLLRPPPRRASLVLPFSNGLSCHRA